MSSVLVLPARLTASAEVESSLPWANSIASRARQCRRWPGAGRGAERPPHSHGAHLCHGIEPQWICAPEFPRLKIISAALSDSYTALPP